MSRADRRNRCSSTFRIVAMTGKARRRYVQVCRSARAVGQSAWSKMSVVISSGSDRKRLRALWVAARVGPGRPFGGRSAKAELSCGKKEAGCAPCSDDEGPASPASRAEGVRWVGGHRPYLGMLAVGEGNRWCGGGEESGFANRRAAQEEGRPALSREAGVQRLEGKEEPSRKDGVPGP